MRVKEKVNKLIKSAIASCQEKKLLAVEAIPP